MERSSALAVEAKSLSGMVILSLSQATNIIYS